SEWFVERCAPSDPRVPTALALDPPIGSLVSVNNPYIAITFNMPLAAWTGKIYIRSMDGIDREIIDVSPANSIKVSFDYANNPNYTRIPLNVNTMSIPATTYYVIVTATAFRTTSSEQTAFPGLLVNGTWNMTTINCKFVSRQDISSTTYY